MRADKPDRYHVRFILCASTLERMMIYQMTELMLESFFNCSQTLKTKCARAGMTQHIQALTPIFPINTMHVKHLAFVSN